MMNRLLMIFLKSSKAAVSIESAAVIFMFSAFLYICYDVYGIISLQNKLERVTYATASLFRERSELYPVINDNTGLDNSICASSNREEFCFPSHELFDAKQVNELKEITSSLLGQNTDLQVNGYFALQNVNDNTVAPSIAKVSTSSCTNGSCSDEITNYFNNQPGITDEDYLDLAPYVTRDITSPAHSGNNGTLVGGRWIPLYEVSMCLENNDSLYMKLIGRSETSMLSVGNLCHEVIVLSRCNELADSDNACPVYIYE